MSEIRRDEVGYMRRLGYQILLGKGRSLLPRSTGKPVKHQAGFSLIDWVLKARKWGTIN